MEHVGRHVVLLHRNCSLSLSLQLIFAALVLSPSPPKATHWNPSLTTLSCKELVLLRSLASTVSKEVLAIAVSIRQLPSYQSSTLYHTLQASTSSYLFVAIKV